MKKGAISPTLLTAFQTLAPVVISVHEYILPLVVFNQSLPTVVGFVSICGSSAPFIIISPLSYKPVKLVESNDGRAPLNFDASIESIIELPTFVNGIGFFPLLKFLVFKFTI